MRLIVLISILSMVCLSGCRYAGWSSTSGGGVSVVQRLDGTYVLESRAEQCEGPIESTHLSFDLLERLSDGVRVTVEHTQSIDRRPHFVCFDFTYPDRDAAQRCIDLFSPDYTLTKSGIDWTPRVRQSFPYNLGISRRYFRGRVTALNGGILLEQEVRQARIGLLGTPRLGSQVVRCELKRIGS